jgi:hypothetical protein
VPALLRVRGDIMGSQNYGNIGKAECVSHHEMACYLSPHPYHWVAVPPPCHHSHDHNCDHDALMMRRARHSLATAPQYGCG